MKIDRLVSIIMVLLDRERIGAQELADRFEVSLRTIYRDIDAINMAGIPVRSAPGVGGGFEIMPRYKVDQKVFSTADLSALLTGLSSLSGMGRGGELAHALAKVRSFIPADRAKDVELKVNQLSIDWSPWAGNRNIEPFVETIQTALRENRLLSFDYVAHRGDRTARTVEPYRLVLKGGRWYLQGYCRAREDFRLFRLSRMTNLRLRAETFAPRAPRPPQLTLDGDPAAIQTEIRLRIHHSILDRILDLCAYENLTPDGGEHYLVRFPFIENDYFYDLLLGFGDKCECLGPPPVRAEMQRRTRALAALYEK